MRKIIALLGAFLMLFYSTANAGYTGVDIYNYFEKSFNWMDDNVSPLGNTDLVASDYYVMAMRRAGKIFEYNKYIQITGSLQPVTIQDAHRTVVANAAAGGVLHEEFIADKVYNCEYTRALDKATAIIALLGGEYKIESTNTDINRMAISLLEMQNIDGSFDGDVLSTAKSIIALSFLSGNCYIIKGEEMGEKYRYDVNAAILRGVDYLQKNKQEDFGFGNVINTSFVVMALDAAGVDADNDPGFSDGNSSTLSALIKLQNKDGKFGNYADDTAIATCALVSHLRAMQGNSMFYALRTDDMPYNPNEYEEINHSGEGLKVQTQDEIEVILSKPIMPQEEADIPHEITTSAPVETQPYSQKSRTAKIWLVVFAIVAIIALVIIIIKSVIFFVYIRPKRKTLAKKPDDDDEEETDQA